MSVSEYQNGAVLGRSQKQRVRRKAEKALGRIESGVGTEMGQERELQRALRRVLVWFLEKKRRAHAH